MDIPRYAKLPSGTLFPFYPVSMKRVTEELSATYSLSTKGSNLEWSDKAIEGGRSRVYTPIPARYEDLIRRFLFRGKVLAELLSCKEGIGALTEDIREALKTNLLYHFNILGFCRAGFRAASEQGEDVNVRLFDIYMVEEHYVGRHDPAAVIMWQRDHGECNLRTANVFTLGE